jgi:hypothetical protein
LVDRLNSKVEGLVDRLRGKGGRAWSTRSKVSCILLYPHVDWPHPSSPTSCPSLLIGEELWSRLCLTLYKKEGVNIDKIGG